LELLKLTLATLRENTTGVDYELIIADDNSNPDTISFLISVDAKLVLNSRKMGPGGVASQGSKLASGKYVAIIDNDLLLSEGWLSGLIKELEKHQAQLIAPNRFRDMLYPDSQRALREAWYRVKDTDELWYRHPLETFFAFSKGRDINEFSRDVLATSLPSARQLTCPPDFVGGCCIVYDNAFVESVGGAVDRAFYSYGADDADLCWRIGAAGGKVLRSGKVYVHHFEHGSVSEGKVNYQESVERNSKVLFHHWDEVLQGFICGETRKGHTVEDLRSSYMLVSKYLDQDPNKALCQ